MEYLVKDYGAVADGITDDAASIQAAIDACSENGGGRVVVSSGNYLCSTIVLKSNIDFYMEMGSRIISSLDRNCYNSENSALFEAKNEENISISGFGTIDGRSQEIYYDDNQDPLHEAPFDYPYGAFRPRTTMFENVKNLNIRDITIKNSVFWTLHIAGCSYVTISGVKIMNDIRCNNTDGIDPDCCKNVVISDCIITAGDDPVVIKTTREMSEKYGSCENIAVNNCVFKTKSAGLKIGTETWGDIRNIVMSNCVIEECGRAVAIWARDGAVIENISISNIRATCRAYNACTDNKHIGAGYPYWWGKGEAVYISNTVRDNDSEYSGTIKNITFSDMNIYSESSVFIAGSKYGTIEDIDVLNCKLYLKKSGSQNPGWFDFRPSPLDIKEHSIPGIYISEVKAASVKNVSIKFIGQEDAWSELIQLENVENAYLDGITGEPAKEGIPAIKVDNIKTVNVNNIRTNASIF